MHCPGCRTSHLVVIDMRVRGEAVRMTSCSSCDARWWENAAGTLRLADVLELASSARAA